MSDAGDDPKEREASSPTEDCPGSEVTSQGSIEDAGERIVQISTPTHAHELLACVGKLRHVFSTADVNIVARGEVFRVHRFLVTHFSKFLARALSPEAGEAVPVVFVEEVEADIMAYLLDYMYGNLAILKESKLLRFLSAARRLEIDCLQTPGLKSLETSLAKNSSTTPCAAFFSEGRETEGATGGDRGGGGGGGGACWDVMPPGLKFPSSLEITMSPRQVGGHSMDGRSCAATNAREQASEQKDEESAGAKGRGKCCHCSCRWEGEARSSTGKDEGDGAPGTEGEVTAGSEEEQSQTLMKKLEKCGTKITGSTLSMLQVPAWLFSSKNISITPVKEELRNVRVSDADESKADKASLATQDKADEADAPVIIGASPPPPPVPPKRNLMPAFQTSTRAQVNGHSPRGGVGYPWPRGSHGGVRGPYAMNQRYPPPRFIASNIHGVPQLQQNPRKRPQICNPRQMPSAIPARVLMTQKFKRGRRYVASPPHGNGFNALGSPRGPGTPPSGAGRGNADWDQRLSQQPRVIVNNILSPRGRPPYSPSGRGSRGRRGRGRPPHLPSSHSLSSEDVTKAPGGSQGHYNGISGAPLSSPGKSLLHWDGKQLLEFRDTGIVIQLPDNVAEVIAGAPVLTPVVPGLDEGRSPDFQVAQTGSSSYQAPVTSVEGPPCTAEQQIVQQNPLPENSVTASVSKESLDATLPSGNIAPQGKSFSSEGLSGDTTESESQPPAPPQSAEGPGREETAEGEGKEQLAKGENCSNATSAESSMKTRQRSKKTFRCPVCRKMYPNPSALLMHQRQHVGERLRHCSSCAFRSEAQSTLVTHVKRKHGRLLLECEKVCHPAPEIEPNSSSKKRKKNKDKEEEEQRKDEGKGKVGNTEHSAEENGEPVQSGNDDKAEIPDQAEKTT